MKRKMVECEDGRIRQARIYGIPREEGDFLILQAGVRVKGKHVTGEAWHNRKTGAWHFLAGLESKNMNLLPRLRERPEEYMTEVLRSPTIRTL
jgi:hypothetical protein